MPDTYQERLDSFLKNRWTHTTLAEQIRLLTDFCRELIAEVARLKDPEKLTTKEKEFLYSLFTGKKQEVK